MKRVLSLALASLIAASCFASCGQAGDGSPENGPNEAVQTQAAETAEETEPSYLETLGQKDFGGEKYIITVSQAGDLPCFAGELNGEVVNDALYNRDRSVENAYNIVIENHVVPEGNQTAIDITNSTLAGDFYSDIYMDCLSDGKNYMGYAFQHGVLYNLLDVPYLSLDQSWWSSLLYDKLQYNGRMFFTSGDIATPSYISPSCLFMDLQVAENNSVSEDEIYKLVYDGAWTIDEVMKRTQGLKRDLNGDGVIQPADDAYGITSANIWLTSNQICVGAGIKFCEIDDSGLLSINLNNEKTHNILNKLKECFCEITPSDDWSPIFTVFKMDRILFLVHFVGTAIGFRDMESDFTVLPMPKYSAEQESYMSLTNPWNHSYVSIPLIQNDIERTGFITEALEYMTVETVRPTIYDVTLKGKVARNEDSQRMLDIIFDTTYIDFNTLCNIGETAQIVCDALFAGKEFVSAYEKKADSINKQLEALMALFE
ncbi:MAG: hypothetical protein K6D94_13160 [Clostridiales bacterium]|nr:hypothetical protein [Clostridiales bacterium]